MFKGNNANQTNMSRGTDTNSPDKLNRIVTGTDIQGEIVTDSNIRIDGTVTGTVSVKGKLVVGATGKVKGDIVCENAEIEGEITGKISVNGLLSLKSTARLECDIITKKLAIEPGAVFTGSCTMGGGAIKDTKELSGEKQYQEARQQKIKEHTPA